jgi:phosphoglycerol transferase MdoB-like AlkP superfamily enzyme
MFIKKNQTRPKSFTRVLLSIFTLFLIINFCFRIVFYFIFEEKSSLNDIFHSLYLGFKFDARLSAIITIITGLFLTFSRSIGSLIFFILSSVLIFIHFTDIGHYAYLKKRINVSFLDNLENPQIAMQMMWQTYPLISITIGFLFFCSLTFFVFKRITKTRIIKGRSQIPSFLFFFLLMAPVIYAKFSYYPLRWSDAYFSPQSFISQWTLNPALNFVETLNFSDQNYDPEKAKEYYPIIKKFLNIKDNSYFRSFEGSENTNHPNVILIQLESLAADKTTLFANSLNPTPSLQKIADKSLVFKKFFTPTIATARGVWATITGLADTSLQKSSSRNPFIARQTSIFDQFENYEKFYFLGGSASWGNIRSIFTTNISGIKVFEEGSFQNENRVDVWGISDLDLFKNAHNEFKKLNSPFIAYIQSAGFHRPYTIPEDNDGFTPIKNITNEDLEKNGFESLEQLNSIYFQDFALGRFLELAKKSSYYQNTIFVIFGDHGLPTTKDSINISKGFYQHDLVLHNVPLVIHYPEKLEPQINEEAFGGLHDILPTVASIAGQSWRTDSLGRNLLEQREKNQNYTFLFSWERPFTISMIGPDELYRIQGEKKTYLNYKTNQPIDDKVQENYLDQLTQAFYYTNNYLIQNHQE